MTELIKIYKEGIRETVIARDLHQFLEVKTRFNDWIRNRVQKYGFVENEDYIVVTKKIVTEGYDYYLSLDMAKELSMVENNDKGREARQYFIAVEKRAREMQTFKIPQTYAEALRLAADQAEQIAIMAPKAELADKAIRDEKEHYSITQAGKHLGIRQSEMFRLLRDKKMLTSENLPTQKAMDAGILQLRTNPNCNGRNRSQSIMTMENIFNFQKKILKQEVIY